MRYLFVLLLGVLLTGCGEKNRFECVSLPGGDNGLSTALIIDNKTGELKIVQPFGLTLAIYNAGDLDTLAVKPKSYDIIVENVLAHAKK